MCGAAVVPAAGEVRVLGCAKVSRVDSLSAEFASSRRLSGDRASVSDRSAMVVRGAQGAGAEALMGLAAAAANEGGGLADAVGDDDELEAVVSARGSRAGSVAGDASGGEDEDDRRGAPPPIGGRQPRAAAAPDVSEELAAIAVAAHPALGPKIVNALAESRAPVRLERATVKFLEVFDAAAPGRGAFKQLRRSIADPEAFRALSSVLFTDLGRYDEDLVPVAGGLYDAPTLLATLLELMELCEKPYNSQMVAVSNPGPPAQGGSELATAMVALGASLGKALDGRLPTAVTAEKKSEKMDLRSVLEKMEAYNTRQGGESILELWEVANRTLLRRIHDHVVAAGVWPVDKELAPDAMAPFASPTGLFSATDEPSMELNAATGKVEDRNRDRRRRPPRARRSTSGRCASSSRRSPCSCTA